MVATHKSKQSCNSLRPGNKLPLHAHSTRAQIDAPPRVQFNIKGNEEIQFDAGLPPQLMVDSSTASTQQQQPQPMPILQQPTIISSESIADRVKKRRGTPLSSIAERVAQQRRESTNPVLDHNTGKLLEYRSCCGTPSTKNSRPKQEQMNLAG